MKLTKSEKDMLRKQFAKTWRNNDMVEYCVSHTSGYAEIGDCIVTFDKPHIETWFCFGEHGYDYDEVNETCRKLSTDEDYFIAKNMREFNRLQKLIAETRQGYYKPWLVHHGDGSDLGYVTFTDIFEEPRGKDPLQLTSAGLDVYAELVADEREKFEKRLRTYLKRYGMSKCRFWTYWADR